MYHEWEQAEREIDEVYRQVVAYDLARELSWQFVDSTPPGAERLAALSIATARYDAVRRDLALGRLSLHAVTALYRKAIRYRVTTPQMAAWQLQLLLALQPLQGSCG